ncbi:hypothetical protein BKI52_45100 [marine bacterium AO1-C]|nr:hypothetical protein BKI52_45100 [marine bacterium AO1-C]
MKTKLEKRADQLWKTYEASSPAFWRKYEHLLGTAKDKVIKREETLLSVKNTASYTLYEIENSKTSSGQINPIFELLFSAFCITSLLAGLITASLDASKQHFIYIYVITFIVTLGLLWDIFFKKDKEPPQVSGYKVLNFAPDHITIERGDEVKKIGFKYLTKIKYQKHCFRLTAKFPDHEDREYTIPLFDSKGQKLAQAQIKHIYQRLKIGVQNNR